MQRGQEPAAEYISYLIRKIGFYFIETRMKEFAKYAGIVDKTVLKERLEIRQACRTGERIS